MIPSLWTRIGISGGLLLAAAGIIFRRLVRRDYLRTGKLERLTAFLQALLFFVYGGFPSLYVPRDWPAVHTGRPQMWVGLGLIALGLTIILFGMAKLGLTRSLGRDEPRLEIAGLYRVSRNPQAVGCGLYVVGFILLWPSWFALVWGLMYAVIIHTMVLTEEEYLLDLLGQVYADYLHKVPRYLGMSRKSRLNV